METSKTMKILNELDTEPFYFSYLFANTPRWLYNKFRENQSLFSFAKTHSIPDLVKQFNDLVNIEERSVDEVAAAYTILMSFTFLPLREAIEAFKQLEFVKLDWGWDVIDIFQQEAKSSGTASIVFPDYKEPGPDSIFTTLPTTNYKEPNSENTFTTKSTTNKTNSIKLK